MRWNKVVAIGEGLLLELEDEAQRRGLRLEELMEVALEEWMRLQVYMQDQRARPLSVERDDFFKHQGKKR